VPKDVDNILYGQTLKSCQASGSTVPPATVNPNATQAPENPACAVAYWPLDDTGVPAGENITLTDLGQLQDADVIGVPQFANANGSIALRMNGKSTYVVVPFNETYDLERGTSQVAFQVTNVSTDIKGIMTLEGKIQDIFIYLLGSDVHMLVLKDGQERTVVVKDAVKPLTWHTMVASWSPTELRLWIDQTSAVTEQTTTTSAPTTTLAPATTTTILIGNTTTPAVVVTTTAAVLGTTAAPTGAPTEQGKFLWGALDAAKFQQGNATTPNPGNASSDIANFFEGSMLNFSIFFGQVTPDEAKALTDSGLYCKQDPDECINGTSLILKTTCTCQDNCDNCEFLPSSGIHGGCLLCKPGLILYQGQCLTDCPEGLAEVNGQCALIDFRTTVLSTCINNKDSLTNTTCACTPDCFACRYNYNFITECLVCMNGKFRLDGTCLDKCPVGFKPEPEDTPCTFDCSCVVPGNITAVADGTKLTPKDRRSTAGRRARSIPLATTSLPTLIAGSIVGAIGLMTVSFVVIDLVRRRRAARYEALPMQG